MSAFPPQTSQDNAGLKPAKVTRIRKRQSLATVERIQPERNLEKWPIWQPAHSQNKQARTFTRTFKDEVGNAKLQKVVVDYTSVAGTLTTEDQKTYYALVKHWQDRGREPEWTYFSLRHLAKLLRKKWGTNVIQSLSQSLTRLRSVPIYLSNVYELEAGEQIEDSYTINILSELRVMRRKRDGHITQEAGYFKFHDVIIGNLLINYTKPVLFETVINFKSEIAQILYTYLDLILADKIFFTRRTKELFDELGLRGTSYAKPAERKRGLQAALKELEGVPLTTGCIVSAVLERTKDGKDYKIVVRKGARQFVLENNDSAEEGRGQEQQGEPDSSKQQITNEADEIVRYFYKLFFNTDKCYPTSNQINQATSLIAQHGFDKAKYIIDFSKRAAGETNYKPQTFGGILQYTTRALAEWDRRKLQEEQLERIQAEQQARMRQEEEARTIAKQRLESLAPDEYQQLYEKVKAEVFNRASGWMTNRPSSAILEGTIRAGMIAELERQDAEPPPETQTA